MDAVDEESIGLEQNVGVTEDQTGFGEINLISLGGNFFNSIWTRRRIHRRRRRHRGRRGRSGKYLYRPLRNRSRSEYPNLRLVCDAPTNPLVDAGTTGPLVPEVDLYGMNATTCPISAPSNSAAIHPTGVAEPIEESGLAFEFFPNPAVDALNIVNIGCQRTEFLRALIRRAGPLSLPAAGTVPSVIPWR